MKSRIIIAVLAILSVCSCSSDRSTEPPTAWMKEARLGAFMHFLPGESNFDLVDQFDVDYLADQLKSIGAGYFVFTLGQNSGYYNAPNPVYDEISGYKAGERTSERDIPMELAKALKKRGIPMMLYLPMQTPNRDMQAVVNFGFPAEAENQDRQFTVEGTDNWAKVIGWWSDHYGKLVRGWWFDGGYEWIGVNDSIREKYSKAVKSGNSRSIACFNCGVVDTPTKTGPAEDYTSGEVYNLLEARIPGDSVDGIQSHVLSFIGGNWGTRDCRFNIEDLKRWVVDATGKGTAVTLDMGPNYDPEVAPVGSISKEQADQFRQLSVALK